MNVVSRSQKERYSSKYERKYDDDYVKKEKKTEFQKRRVMTTNSHFFQIEI